MSGWRGALMARLPASFLRAGSDMIDSQIGRVQECAPAGPAEVLRGQNHAALRSALSTVGLATRSGRSAGKSELYVSPADRVGPHLIQSIAARSGLRLLNDPQDPGDRRFYFVAGQGTGRPDIDAALAVELVTVEDVSRPTLPDVLDPDFDIDVVYTWVDGHDPEWRARRHAAMFEAQQHLPHTSTDAGRFDTHDELRHSLRSVAYFAPWVRRIHIVTDGQVPPWLDISDERIRIVEHTEIFTSAGNLPTFNSHAIEAQIHHIPGLAEHFIYMNDDVFLGQPARPRDFFTPDGQPRFFLSVHGISSPGHDDLPVDVAARNNRRIIEERFGKTTSFKFLHAPHAQLRSTLELIERDHGDAVGATTAAKFRSWTDLSIPSSLAHYYGLALGSAVASNIDYKYVDISEPQAQVQLLRLIRRVPAVFCLNEVTAREGKRAEVSKMLAHFLATVFPVASTFETSARCNSPTDGPNPGERS